MAKHCTDLHVNSLVKVFVFLDEGLDAVQGVTLVITGEEGFTSCHPVLSLLTVPVEELQGEEDNSQSVSGALKTAVSNNLITFSNWSCYDSTLQYLELEALVQHHATLHPGLLKVSTLTV